MTDVALYEWLKLLREKDWEPAIEMDMWDTVFEEMESRIDLGKRGAPKNRKFKVLVIEDKDLADE